MTIAYWCILIAGLIPIVAASIAKAGAYVDNKLPRESVLFGYRLRANAAHFNSYEAFPLFAAAVICALMQHAPASTVNILAVIYVITRVGYVGCYIADCDRVRSLTFMVALAVNIMIFLLPLIVRA